MIIIIINSNIIVIIIIIILIIIESIEIYIHFINFNFIKQEIYTNLLTVEKFNLNSD